nr:flippase-like domain-containing protein [Candidatus Omnitrophota bacterium]
MLKNKLSIVLRFVVSLGLLLALIWIMRKDAREIFNILKGSDKALILLAVFMNILLTIVVAYRLKLMLSGQKIELSIKDAVRFTFIGCFFNSFLPTAIGGDIAKAYYVSKKTNNKVASYAAILADRILGLIAILLVALAGLFFIGKSLDNKFIVWMIPVAFLLTIAIIAVLLKKNNTPAKASSGKRGIFYAIKEKLLKLYIAINIYRDNPALLVKGIVLSLVLQIASIFSIYLFILCIGADMSIFRLFLVIPLVWAVSMLPSLNGLGVREGAFVYFLKGYIGPEKAFTISLLWLGLIMLYSIIGGLFQLLYPVKVKGGYADD